MRPFFSYYGSKWSGAKYYGPPRRDLVVEPFAGSASYSVRWNAPSVRLYDVSDEICALWDWLINCSDSDISAVPDRFESMDEVFSLDLGPQILVRFWVSKGRAEASNTLSPWYFQWRNSGDCKVWGEPVKNRIIAQKPLIRCWSVERASYDQIPNIDAHWHIDPPYNNAAGARYPHNEVDFGLLAEWAKSRNGAVDVCENVGAEWLPFTPLYQTVTTRGRRSGAVTKEAVWRLN